MNFRIKLAGDDTPELSRIDALLWQADPAALVDRDAGDGSLRVTAWIPADQLADMLVQAGFPPSEVSQLPSICCGDCSG